MERFPGLQTIVAASTPVLQMYKKWQNLYMSVDKCIENWIFYTFQLGYV